MHFAFFLMLAPVPIFWSLRRRLPSVHLYIMVISAASAFLSLHISIEALSSLRRAHVLRVIVIALGVELLLALCGIIYTLSLSIAYGVAWVLVAIAAGMHVVGEEICINKRGLP